MPSIQPEEAKKYIKNWRGRDAITKKGDIDSYWVFDWTDIDKLRNFLLPGDINNTYNRHAIMFYFATLQEPTQDLSECHLIAVSVNKVKNQRRYKDFKEGAFICSKKGKNLLLPVQNKTFSVLPDVNSRKIEYPLAKTMVDEYNLQPNTFEIQITDITDSKSKKVNGYKFIISNFTEIAAQKSSITLALGINNSDQITLNMFVGDFSEQGINESSTTLSSAMIAYDFSGSCPPDCSTEEFIN